MFDFETTELGLHVKSGAIAVFLDTRLCGQLYDRIDDQDTPDFLIKETDITFNGTTFSFSQSEYIEFRDTLTEIAG